MKITFITKLSMSSACNRLPDPGVRYATVELCQALARPSQPFEEFT
jgi:hypothetical protein